MSAPDLGGTYLDRIVSAHRRAATRDGRDLADLRAEARRLAETRRFSSASAAGFADRLAGPGLSVIAEIKRRSPSKGDLAPALDAGQLARSYVAGGAACLSVLTDVDHFGGSVADLQSARTAAGVPVLRKDFTVSEADVYDASVMGADCVLLIVAALSDDELSRFFAAARAVDLETLFEVHDEAEFERVLRLDGPRIVGVNQRDLHTFAVDHERALRVGSSMPSDMVRVAESGVRGPGDAAALAAGGFDAILVGESLVTSADPAAAVRALIDAAAVCSPGARGHPLCS